MRRSQIIFVVIIALALGVVAISALLSGGKDGDSDHPSSTRTPHYDTVTVTGYIGSEKENFLRDPEIQRILAQRYGLTVNFTKMGSIEQVTTASTGLDFLWPSNEVALALYRER